MSPPAKTPAWPVIMFGPTLHDAVVDLDPGHAVEQREVGLLAEREHERVGLELLELAGGLREAGLVELHLLDHELALVGLLDRGEPLHHHALLLRLLDLEVVRGHPLARAPVDDDRLLGAEALGGAGHVHRGVAAAVDDHAPPEQRLLLALHAAQQRDRVEDVRGLAGGDVGALADVRPDREEGGVEAALAASLLDVRDLACSARASRPCRGCAAPRRRARRAAAGTWGCRSASCPPAIGPASWIVTAWPSRVEVVGGRQAGGPGADDQHALAGRRRRRARPSSPA